MIWLKQMNKNVGVKDGIQNILQIFRRYHLWRISLNYQEKVFIDSSYHFPLRETINPIVFGLSSFAVAMLVT